MINSHKKKTKEPTGGYQSSGTAASFENSNIKSISLTNRGDVARLKAFKITDGVVDIIVDEAKRMQAELDESKIECGKLADELEKLKKSMKRQKDANKENGDQWKLKFEDA